VLHRERLAAALAEAAPVAWITAAPGSGKTTLAASELERSAAKALWYEVDAGDDDPAAFFDSMRKLAATLSSPRAARLPALAPEGGADLAVFAQRFFSAFFALLPARAIWVIDNFQEATGPALALVLREAFSHIPRGVRVVVLSLVEPPRVLARLIANGVIRPIAGTALRFTRAESDALVLSKLDASAELLAELHDKSAGWAAGLVLMIDRMRCAGTTPALPSLEESEAAVFDYFAEEILAGCSADEQRTLMLTSALPRVTPQLATAMSERDDVSALLERLHRRHLFVERHGGDEPSYQFHRLFKIFLAERARRTLPPRDRSDAAARAATLLEQQGDAEDAITMHLAASHWSAAARLVVLHARRLHDEGRWRTLRDAIAALPDRCLDDDPWLAYWAGACQVWVDAPLARGMLERAFDGFAACGARTGQVLAAGALTRACLLDPDWFLLDRWIDSLDALLAASGDECDAQVLLVGYSRLVYAALARRPRAPALATWAARTHELLATATDPNDALLAGYSLVFYCTWTGQAARGEDVVRRLAPVAHDPRTSPVSLAHWLFAYGNHLLRFGDPAEALAASDRALDTAASHGLRIEGVIRRHRVGHLLTLGRLAEAEGELARLATAPRVEPYFEMRAWAAWQRGRLAEATEDAHAALGQASERGRTFYRIFDLMLLTLLSASAGAPEQAREFLRQYREETTAMPGDFATFQALLAEAFIAIASGAAAESHAPLSRALEIGSRQRLSSWWGWSPAVMVALLDEALRQGFFVPYCRDLVRTHRLAPASADVDDWPWPVRVRTLGRFEVELNGARLRFEGKAQRKPLDLLKMLAASGTSPVPIDHLIDQLWPDPDDGGRKAFDITVHRLRKLLACDAAVVVADLHASLDARHVWVDAWSVERLLEQLVPIIGASASGDRLESAAARVFALVDGPFLPGEKEARWLVAARRRIAARLHRFAERLGEHWEATRQWSRAGQLYQRMTELDPLAASFYRRQMLCLRAEGRRAEAIEVFRRCREHLATTLGVAPDPELERVYGELVAAKAPTLRGGLRDSPSVGDP